MKNRPLFVFAEQSNMMGACVYPPKEQFNYSDSYEYLHKPRRMGKESGSFKNYGFPSGEYSYADLQEAYGDNRDPEIKSSMKHSWEHTYFAPSMCNFKSEDGKQEPPF